MEWVLIIKKESGNMKNMYIQRALITIKNILTNIWIFRAKKPSNSTNIISLKLLKLNQIG